MGQKVNNTIFKAGLKNYDWNFKYTDQSTEESTLFLYKNVEINKYINNLFKKHNIIIKNFKLEHTNYTVKILIYFYKLNSTKSNTSIPEIKSKKQLISNLITKILSLNSNLFLKSKITQIKAQDLEKKFEVKINKNLNYLFAYKKFLKLFKKFLNNSSQKDIIKILFIVISEKNSSKLLSEIIATYLTKNKKKHNYLIFLLKHVITYLIKSDFSKVKGVKIVINGRFNGAPRSKQKTITIGIVKLQSLNEKTSYHNSTAFTQNGTFGIKVWICEKNISYDFTT